MSDIALPVSQTRAEGLLGASDAACALGLDPYKSPLTLWRQLRGELVDDARPAFVQEAAEWGQALEPIVRGKYALGKPAAVFVPDASFTFEDWLRCTPDGIVVLAHPNTEHFDDIIGSTHALAIGPVARDRSWEWRAIKHARETGTIGLYQGKTCSAYKRDEWVDWIPQAYEIQVRVEMAVTRAAIGAEWCDVSCLVGGQTYRGPFRVERDDIIEHKIVSDLRRFWESTKTGKEPSVDDSAAWRQYASSKMRASKVVMTPSAELERDIAAWKQARQAKSVATRCEAEIKTKLLLACSAAGATAIDLGDAKISAYQTGARSDWRAYALSLGGKDKVPEQFKGKPGGWTLRAPWGDDDE